MRATHDSAVVTAFSAAVAASFGSYLALDRSTTVAVAFMAAAMLAAFAALDRLFPVPTRKRPSTWSMAIQHAAAGAGWLWLLTGPPSAVAAISLIPFMGHTFSALTWVMVSVGWEPAGRRATTKDGCPDA